MSSNTSDENAGDSKSSFGGLYAEKDAVAAAARALSSLLPPDAVRLVYDGFSLTSQSGSRTMAFTASGQAISMTGSSAASQAFNELRRVMYKPGLGSWWSVRMTVWADGHAQTEFNFDEEPDNRFPPGGVAYLTDLQTYPIDEDKRPEWLRRKIVEGIADLRHNGPKSYPRWLKDMIAQGNKPEWL
ncbi:MAG: hypothetical protein FWF25_09310 [Propionibacteriaceae bacterium]|nr:hypothetical protein [Propionibacteriaceae bacterium]